MKPVRVPLMALLIVGLVTNFAGLASALVTSSVDATVSGSGAPTDPYVYGYEVFNDISSDEDIWDFWIFLDPSGTVGVFEIVAPLGWDWVFTDTGDPTVAFEYVEWPSDWGSEIVPGASQDGFGFKSLGPPGTVDYRVEGTWGGFEESTTTGPVAAVPEPGTMLLLGCGIVGVAGYVARKRKRA
jgi:hypothetical protein